MDQAASPHQGFLRDHRECGEDPDMDRRVGLRAGCNRAQAVESGRITLHIDAGVFSEDSRINPLTTNVGDDPVWGL